MGMVELTILYFSYSSTVKFPTYYVLPRSMNKAHYDLNTVY